MREIGFRCQRVDNGEWVYGMPIYGNLDTTFTEMQCYINNRYEDNFAQRLGIYAVPDAETLKLNINLNRVLHIYLVSSSYLYEISRISNKIDNFM